MGELRLQEGLNPNFQGCHSRYHCAWYKIQTLQKPSCDWALLTPPKPPLLRSFLPITRFQLTMLLLIAPLSAKNGLLLDLQVVRLLAVSEMSPPLMGSASLNDPHVLMLFIFS